MLLEHERDYVLGMDAPIIECTRTRSLLWFGYGCFLHEIHLNTIVIMVWAWMLKMQCTRTRSLLWFWHGCSQARMRSNTNGSIAWPWVLPSSSALEHERYVVHGCSGNRMLLEHKRYYGLNMDAPNIECIQTRSIIERRRTRML